MRAVALRPGLRLLLGVLGAVTLVAGIAAGATELRSATQTPARWPAITLALACLAIGCTGALLLRGAWRGRMAVRDPAGRTSRHGR